MIRQTPGGWTVEGRASMQLKPKRRKVPASAHFLFQVLHVWPVDSPEATECRWDLHSGYWTGLISGCCQKWPGVDYRSSLLLLLLFIPSVTVGENVCNNSKKPKKSCFWILKKRKKRTYSFTGHLSLITQPLVLNYRKSVPVSHQHQTSCSEMRTQETMQLRNVCDKRQVPITSQNNQNVQRWLRMDHTPGAGNWIRPTVITERSIWTQFDGLRTKLLLKTFYEFLIRHFKKT